MIPADSRAAILESLRAGVTLAKAARAVRTTEAKVRAEAVDDPDFADALEAAEAEGGWLNASAASEAATVAEHEARRPKNDGPIVHRVAEDAPLDVDAVRREAAALAPGPMGTLLWLDAKLVAHGFSAMSPWWTQTIRDFYASGKRWLLVRVGRGGGKSTTLVRVAVADAMFTDRIVPPGQRWTWPFISAATDDARRRIVEIQAMLQAIGIGVPISYPQGKPTIDLYDARGNAISFVSIAGTIAGTSGPNTIGVTIDEEAKLRDKSRNANPATEILTSLAQTFRARPDIRAIRCSSAWTTEGSHANAIAEGDTGATHVARIGVEFLAATVDGLLEVASWESARGDSAGASAIRQYAATVTAESANVPTWIANPTISAMASRVEVDGTPSTSLGGVSRAVYWLRENASVPMLPGGSHGTPFDQITGLAEANARLVSRAREATLRQFDSPSLSSEDPRSIHHVPPWTRGPTL